MIKFFALSMLVALSSSFARAQDSCAEVFRHITIVDSITKNVTTRKIREIKPTSVDEDARVAMRSFLSTISRHRREELFFALIDSPTGFFGEFGRNEFNKPGTDKKYFALFTYQMFNDAAPGLKFRTKEEERFANNLMVLARGPLNLMLNKNRSRIFVDHRLSNDDKTPFIFTRFMRVIKRHQEQVGTPHELVEIKTVREAQQYLRRQAYLEDSMTSPIAVNEMNRRTNVLAQAFDTRRVTDEHLAKIAQAPLDEIPLRLRQDVAVLQLDNAKNLEDAHYRYLHATTVAMAYSKAQFTNSKELIAKAATEISGLASVHDFDSEKTEQASTMLAELQRKINTFTEQINEVNHQAEQLVQNLEGLKAFSEEKSASVAGLEDEIQTSRKLITKLREALAVRVQNLNTSIANARVVLTDAVLADTVAEKAEVSTRFREIGTF